MRPSRYLLYMMRESRGSRGRLGFFIACLAVGVAAVVAVAGLSEGLADAVGREARQLLAADLSIEGRQPLGPEIESFLDSRPGLRRTTLKEMATVVAAPGAPNGDEPGRSQLAELKTVDGEYPFYGKLRLEPPGPLRDLLGSNRTVVASDLLTRLDLAVGDPLRIGRETFEISGVVLSEPDRIGMALTLGPRVLLSGEGLKRADLERFGSRIEYRTLIRLREGHSEAELASLAEELRALPGLESRYRVRTYAEAQPAVRDGLDRVNRFLGLLALLSLFLGGVGVAQTTRSWLAGRIDAIAILRSLGFRPREVLLLYLGQTLALGLAGSLVGAVAGVACLAVTPSLLAGLLPDGLVIGLWQPAAFVRGLALGLGTAVLFSLAPLAETRRVSPLRVLRSDVEPLRASRWARGLAGLVLLVGIAITAVVQAGSLSHGLEFTAALGVAAAALALLSLAAIRCVRWIQSRRFFSGPRLPVWLRHGVAALSRPGAGTVGAVVALGLGMLLLVGLFLVERGLTRQLSTRLPEDSPSAFLIDIQPDQWPGVERILEDHGVESLNSAPVVTARLDTIDGRLVETLAQSSEDRSERWALTREQRVTYLEELAPDNKILAGALWSDPERWELSVEQEYARDLGLELGSVLTLDVQGIPVEFTVTSLRSVDWSTFDLNFFLVAEPGSLDEAPQYRVATLKLESVEEQSAQDRLAAEYPNVTLLRIRDVLEKVRHVLERLAIGVQFLGGFTVLAGLVILSGAVSASSIRRSREIALLKTLGMVRRQVALMFGLEFAFLGLLAGGAGAVGGTLLARAVLTRGMGIDWSFELVPLLAAVATSVLLTAAAAVLAGARALSSRPLEVLRGES